MEISKPTNEQVYIKPPQAPTETQQLEKKNPNVQQNIQVQVQKDATQGPSTPTAQNVQVLASTQAATQLQATAQQQIRNGYLDIKI